MSQRFPMATESVTTVASTIGGDSRTIWYPYPYYDYSWDLVPVRCDVCKGTGKVAVRAGAYYDLELGKIVYPNKKAKKEIKDCKACYGKGFIWVGEYRTKTYPYPIWTGQWIQPIAGTVTGNAYQSTSFNSAATNANVPSFRHVVEQQNLAVNGKINLS